LTGAVAVVKEVLGISVVDIHGMSAPLFEHGAQTDDTGSGFSGANKVSNLMLPLLDQGGNDITAINDVGSGLGNFEVPVVGLSSPLKQRLEFQGNRLAATSSWVESGLLAISSPRL